MDHNPYAPTKGALAEAPVIEDGQHPIGEALLASRWRRLTNFVIDMGGFLVLVQLVGLSFSLLNSSIFYSLLSGAGIYVFELAVFVLYYVPSEFLTGRTLGKLVTRTRVVATSGDRPTFGQVLGRTLLRLVPLESLTFFARGPGLHDRTSNTRVVLIRNA
jgi:uncharacterized RDD family membrane protein YckC